MAELNKLVMRAQAGDLDAYGTLVRLFQDMAVGFAHSKLGDFHLAEDAAQDAFIHAYLDLVKLRSPVAFPGWLRRIVATYCSRQRRKKQVDTMPLEGAAEITASVESPAKLLEQKELSRSLQYAVQTLPEDERTVTYLYYFDEVPQKDIAAFLEIPLTTVKYRLRNSRKLLERELSTEEEFTDMVKSRAIERLPRDEEFAVKVQNYLQALETLHDGLSSRLQIVLSETMERTVDVAIKSVEQKSFAEFIGLLSAPSCAYKFNMKPLQGAVILDLDMSLACALIDHVSGMEGSDQGGLRALALAEYWLLNPTVGRMLKDLESAWEGVLPIKIRDIEVETDPGPLLDQADDAEQTVIHVDLEVRIEKLTASIRMSYPVVTLESILPYLDMGVPEGIKAKLSEQALSGSEAEYDIKKQEVQLVQAGQDKAYILENLYPLHTHDNTALGGDIVPDALRIPNEHGVLSSASVSDLKEQSKLGLKSWWRRPEVYLPFLIMVGDRPAGFAVVEAPPAAPDGVNYYLYHFFLHHPYRDKGVAEKALQETGQSH